MFFQTLNGKNIQTQNPASVSGVFWFKKISTLIEGESLLNDAQGKTYGQAMLMIDVDIPNELRKYINENLIISFRSKDF